MKCKTKTIPTCDNRELAAIRFSDELGLALDNIEGVAYALDTHAEDCACDGERHALNMMAAMLYECLRRVKAARDAVEASTADTSTGAEA